MIKVLLFDFYGVFSGDTLDEWLALHNLERTGHYAKIARAYDTGSTTQDEFFAALSKESSDTIESIAEFFSKVPKITPPMKALAVSLSAKGVTLGILSNGSSKVRASLKEHGIDTLFSSVILSSEVGLVKPDPAIYQHALDVLGVDSSEIIFIDDRPENLAPANEIGMKTLLFTSAEAIEKRLLS